MLMLLKVGSQLSKEKLSVKILNLNSPKKKSMNAMLPSKNLWDLLWLLLAKLSLELQMIFAIIGLNAIKTTLHLILILLMDHTLLTHIPDHLIQLMDLTLLTHIPNHLTQLLHQLSRIHLHVIVAVGGMVINVVVKTVVIARKFSNDMK